MNQPASIALAVRSYIAARPAVHECLRRGLINHSALTRLIAKSLQTRKRTAILAACQRYAAQQRHYQSAERRIMVLLRAMKLRVERDVAVVVVEPKGYASLLADVQQEVAAANEDMSTLVSSRSCTVILPQRFVSSLLSKAKGSVIKSSLHLAKITLELDERLERTPGVVAHIYGLLAHFGINIVEELSCWTDVVLVLQERDLPRVLELLAALSTVSPQEVTG